MYILSALEMFEVKTTLALCAHPMASIFGEGGSKHPLRTLDGCADLLGGGVKPDFEFLGGGPAHPAHPRAHVCL